MNFRLFTVKKSALKIAENIHVHPKEPGRTSPFLPKESEPCQSSVPPLCIPMPRRDSTALTWAWISFQTIYGELVPLEDNSDVTGLAMFILNRLLWNPDIAAEYRHPSVPHLYRDGGWLCLWHVLPTLCAEGVPSSLLSLSDFTSRETGVKVLSLHCRLVLRPRRPPFPPPL